MQARGAAGLDETRQADVVAQRLGGARDRHDVLERRLLGIEIEDAPVGLLQRRDPAAPDVQRNRGHVGDVQERLEVVAHEVADLALRVLAPDSLQLHPLGDKARRVLLKERLAADAVWIPREHHRPVLQVGQEPRGDGAVVLDEIAFGVALLRPEDLVEVGELHLAGRGDEGRGTGRFIRIPPSLFSRPPSPYRDLRYRFVVSESNEHRLPQ